MRNVSVVIASIVGAPFIDECLGSLELQGKRTEGETANVASAHVTYIRAGRANAAGEQAEFSR